MFKKIISAVTALVVIALPVAASAHVVVTPATANVGDYVTFNVSVPNEKDTPVTQIKLVIPAGVKGAQATVKPGWTIATDQTGSGEDATVKSITWSGGEIPVGLRDDFTFRAQAPAKATELDWKAYQTYGDGTVVHWDQKPTGSDDDSGNAGPYSVTKVVNDLTGTASKTTTNSSSATAALIVSLVALVVAFGALIFRKK